MSDEQPTIDDVVEAWVKKNADTQLETRALWEGDQPDWMGGGSSGPTKCCGSILVPRRISNTGLVNGVKLTTKVWVPEWVCFGWSRDTAGMVALGDMTGDDLLAAAEIQLRAANGKKGLGQLLQLLWMLVSDPVGLADDPSWSDEFAKHQKTVADTEMAVRMLEGPFNNPLLSPNLTGPKDEAELLEALN